jgi:hypothetical protein
VSPMTTKKLTVGQEVALVRMSRWSARPPVLVGTGTVTKVSRRYAIADIYGRAYDFDMETGYQRGDENGNMAQVMTRVQFELESRSREAVAYLRERGLEPRVGGRMSHEHLIAVADLVRSFETESGKENDR